MILKNDYDIPYKTTSVTNYPHILSQKVILYYVFPKMQMCYETPPEIMPELNPLSPHTIG